MLKKLYQLPLVIVFLFGTFASIHAAEQSKLQALLVSIEKYELAPLDYAQSDVRTLAEIFMTRYDAAVEACIDWAGDQPNLAGDDGAKQSIMQKIEAWGNAVRSSDTAVLYLAGHGVKDADGKLYLAMVNFDTKNFDSAAIEFSWIRDRFGKCAAKNKLLLVDTCFAGTSKSVDFDQVSMEDVSKSFGELENVVTIASCQAGEKSWLWGKMKHSLFTYWVIEAFKGHADYDGDRVITPDELLQYLQTNVTSFAQKDLEQEQTPTMLNEPAGREIKMPLRASTLNRLIDDIATQIDLQMQTEQYPILGIPEFTTGDGKQIEPQYGLLPRNIADMLRKSLAIKTQKHRSYQVLSDNALQESLKSKGLEPADLGTDKTKNLMVDNKTDIPVMLSGCLSFFEPTGLSIRTELLDLKGKTEVGQSGGVAMLSSKDMALAGISGTFSTPKPNTGYRADPVLGLVSSTEQQEIGRIQENRESLHPLANKDNPYKIEFQVRPANSKGTYKPVDVVIDGNDCFLPLEKGSEYQILVYNQSGKLVFCRLLVDGLNTLSQRMSTKSKGITIEAVPSADGEYEMAPRVSLDEARTWVFDPATSKPKVPFVFPGFYDVNGKADTMRRFQIVDADDSVAARKKYTDQVGLITIAFFKAVPKETRGSGGIGTGMSSTTERVKVTQYDGNMVPSDLDVLYNIRYMTPEAMKKAIKAKKK